MDSTEDTAVQDFLEILEEHRKNCERQGKYVEAEIAKNRLDELKLHEENRRREAIRSRQIAERLGVEEAHMLEFQQFNMIWDRKMTEYETHAEELVEAMKVGFDSSYFIDKSSTSMLFIITNLLVSLLPHRSATRPS